MFVYTLSVGQRWNYVCLHILVYFLLFCPHRWRFTRTWCALNVNVFRSVEKGQELVMSIVVGLILSRTERWKLENWNIIGVSKHQCWHVLLTIVSVMSCTRRLVLSAQVFKCGQTLWWCNCTSSCLVCFVDLSWDRQVWHVFSVVAVHHIQYKNLWYSATGTCSLTCGLSSMYRFRICQGLLMSRVLAPRARSVYVPFNLVYVF